MTAEIKSLFGDDFVAPECVDENIVNLLSEWLERAKKGEFRAVTLIGIDGGGSVHHARRMPGHPYGLMLVAATKLAADRCSEWYRKP